MPCFVCHREIPDHSLVEARMCLATLAVQAETLEARACGGSTPATLARVRRAS